MASPTSNESSSWQHAASASRVVNGSLSPSHQYLASLWPDSDADDREALLHPSSISSAPSSPTRLKTHRKTPSDSTHTRSGSLGLPRVAPASPQEDRFPSHQRESASSSKAVAPVWHAVLTWAKSKRHWSPHRPKLWFLCLSLVFFAAFVVVNMKADSLQRYAPLPERIEITLKPADSIVPPPDSNERFLGYLPHSGFHNQRSALQNALLLARALNRTLLVPPIWVGWPIPTRHYEELAKIWTDVMLVNSETFGIDSLVPGSELNEPGGYPSTLEDFPFPTSKADDPELVEKAAGRQKAMAEMWERKGYQVRADGYPITNLTSKECKSFSAECRHTYKDTFLAWSSLVDLTVLQKEVKMRDRWDMRERAIESMLSVTKDDIYVLKDRQNYDFQFVEKENEDGALIHFTDDPSTHWARVVSIPVLRRMSQRVLLVGSLFGHDRLLSEDRQHDIEEMERYARLLAFRTPEILIPADDICRRLGGAGTFLGVHARVGDGTFAKYSKRNMKSTWENLLEGLGVEKDDVDSLWQSRGFEGAPAKPMPAPVAQRGDNQAVQSSSSQRKHSARRPKKSIPVTPKQDDQPRFRPRAFRLVDRDGSDKAALATKLDHLTCRSPLHAAPELLKFNIPLYLATDSRSPLDDISLSPFFRLFPCTFILSDFEEPNELNMGMAVRSLDRFKRLINAADGLPLRRFFTPFLEAVVAAKAGVVRGTRGSTFSGK
ncbi:BZ3500_MvSof-1268-A1-R1_Chr1-3g02428 [Microbotryum saponariae]|uniref:BZ3500_MvSof-1268-A1-R1_Chr1-3g02428 protein n=1 Tax=Microbotryum saponariae TaxID=289078 RepID=A0A2X0MVJ9_9BASI|nr:BZ3500_MvSof-1268-A1-R1_Chr1-3g02428 [Microbotryum saponariae]SCZ96215.1 BZ3501_MvSof-1269-A2-R1_Chr1-3g02031 [Microbotryum saponariae]